ncbi:MAG: penicillin acylase family protein [Opitutus sp.]
MTDLIAKPIRLIAGVMSVIVLVLAAVGIWFYHELRESMPLLDGTQRVVGLSLPATVTRDAHGVPTVRAATRADVARSLGFIHAQDRFFQMDLLRRRAAGELAEVFGAAALSLDRATRPHHFRALAQEVLGRLPPEQRELLDAYTDGVNSGLTALAAKPFEYFLVRETPRVWKAEDSVLVIYAMILDLQDPTNNYELSLATLRDQLGVEAVAFFAPVSTPSDAALDGTTAPLPLIPGPRVINLRAPKLAQVASETDPAAEHLDNRELQPGSSSFALSGAHTASGSALLANDPHLNLAVPNIWYRAVLEWPVAESGATPRSRIVGVTLPGLPFIVLGSNGHVAWGLTDAYADTNDLVAVDVTTASHNLYRVPGRDDLLTIETRRDTIDVKGGKSQVVETPWTFWGPVIAHDFRDRPLAHHWIAYDPAAINLNFIRLESAMNVAEAIAVAHASGIPAHNFMVVDRAGDIGWTIAGKYPRRVGFDGRLPVSWTFGDRKWDGFVPPDQVPTLTMSSDGKSSSGGGPVSSAVMPGRLWTANNRLVGGAALAQMGDGGYAPPMRGTQIRDQLAKLEHAVPRDFLTIQLDDRGLFLERWRTLLLTVLSPEKTAQKSSRAALRRAVESWSGRASVDSAGYRLLRGFRSNTAEIAFRPLFASCVDAQPAFDWHKFNFEPALWTMLEQKPLHLLSSVYASWDELLLAAVDRTIDGVEREGFPVEKATWGAHNTARIAHPLSRSIPLGLGRWLNLPSDPLPGDVHMPRIQTPSFGASMRIVVSPGREYEGLFEMPGGQSGHPLSDFYRADHQAWVKGEPTPLVPGETQHTLLLAP